MKPLLSNCVRKTLSGLLALSLLSLGACRSHEGGAEIDPDDEGDQQNVVPDIVKSAIQGNASAATIVTLLPAESENSVGRDTNIQVVFSTEMLPESLENAITVFIAGDPVPGTSVVAPAQRKVTFTPAQPLPAGTEVQVVLSDTVSTGHFLCPGTAWVFTTSP